MYHTSSLMTSWILGFIKYGYLKMVCTLSWGPISTVLKVLLLPDHLNYLWWTANGFEALQFILCYVVLFCAMLRFNVQIWQKSRRMGCVIWRARGQPKSQRENHAVPRRVLQHKCHMCILKMPNFTMVVMDLGWVDFDFYVPSSCPVPQPILLWG